MSLLLRGWCICMIGDHAMLCYGYPEGWPCKMKGWHHVQMNSSVMRMVLLHVWSRTRATSSKKQSRYLVSYHSVHRRPRALTEEISRGVNWWLLGSTPTSFSLKFCTNFLNWDLILNQLVHTLISIPLLNNTIQPLLFFQIIQLL